MVRIDFKTPYYDYDVTLIQVESDNDSDAVCKFLLKEEIDKDVIIDIKEQIQGCYVDGGETNWNARTKRIVCVFYEFSSNVERAKLYSHEKRHIEDRILQHCKVDDIEASAYFAGWLGTKFYELWNKSTK